MSSIWVGRLVWLFRKSEEECEWLRTLRSSISQSILVSVAWNKWQMLKSLTGMLCSYQEGTLTSEQTYQKLYMQMRLSSSTWYNAKGTKSWLPTSCHWYGSRKSYFVESEAESNLVGKTAFIYQHDLPWTWLRQQKNKDYIIAFPELVGTSLGLGFDTITSRGILWKHILWVSVSLI